MSRVIKRGVYVKVGITCFCHRDTEATQQDLGKIGWHQTTAKQDKTRAACMIPGKYFMMTSSNGNIFRVTGLLCGNSPVTGEFPAQRPVTRSFDVFFDLHMNKRKNKQSRRRWFETPSLSLWRHRNVVFGGAVSLTVTLLLMECDSPSRALQWRHMSVMASQITGLQLDCLFNSSSRPITKKHQRSA